MMDGFERLAKARSRVAKLEYELGAYREILKRCSRPILEALKADPGLVSRIYWECEDCVGSRDIADALGVKLRDLREIVEPYRIRCRCSEHGEYDHLVRTRNERIETLRKLRHGERALFRTIICPTCVEEQNSEAARIEYLNSMPYREYLQTGHWMERRETKLIASGYRCQLCSGNHRLEVHHNTYERRGAELDEDLVVLCHDCHSHHHGRVRRLELVQ